MRQTDSFIRRFGLAAGGVITMLGAIALGGAGLAAAAPPTLEPLRVYAGGQEATVEVAASEEVAISHTYREGGAITIVQGTWTPAATAFAPTSTPRPETRAGGGNFTPPTRPGGGVNAPVTELVYQPRHRLKLTGLKSSTTYTLTVVATNRAGEKVAAETTFTTLKRRVRVTLDQIVIHSDGDLIGDGEPTWFWGVGRPVIMAKDCFPAAAGKCKEGGFGSGTIVPTTGSGVKFAHVFAEENFQSMGGEDYTTMPTDFFLRTKARESDAGLGWLDALTDWGAFLGGGNEASWKAPLGVETASQTVQLQADDGRFRSTMTFRFELFHDTASFPPNDGRVHSTSK